ncbi:MAG TPA: L-ribulose-5-phosphate 4-epimerase AraD, partial [Acidobacteriaceae bacterium]|nr:L-ribulose-5-phosphate 4-epimerase AraD [Acidobacteriaceae bacterium]
IKPSGVAYEELKPADLVLTDLNGNVMEGSLRPSSDLATHLLLYRAFPTIGGVVHTHSEFATAWAQAGREIPAYGTTHADYFYGPIPVTEELTADEVGGDYVLNTGYAIVRRFSRGAAPGATAIDPLAMPAVLVAGHAPFCWGSRLAEAAHNAVMLEAVARMAYCTSTLNAACTGVTQHLLDRHYFRKHGASKTYGQES